MAGNVVYSQKQTTFFAEILFNELEKADFKRCVVILRVPKFHFSGRLSKSIKNSLWRVKNQEQLI
jgi:hypothetical protein